LLACLAATILMAIPTAYWAGPWGERHPQWRLLLSACGLLFLLKYRSPSHQTVQAITTAAAIALILAYILVVTSSSGNAPTNRIPWMGGLSLLGLAVVSLAYRQVSAPFWLRQFWLAASALAPVTALISGVRGTWPLVLIWPLLLFTLNSTAPSLWRKSRSWLAAGLIIALAGGLNSIPETDSPVTRMTDLRKTETVNEDHRFSGYSESSGIRLALYAAGLRQILEQPILLGTGPEGTKQLIENALAKEGRLEAMPLIGHLHNDALHAWVEFGLFGLSGYLAIAVGLLAMIRQFALGSHEPVVVAALAGILMMHTLTGLSNMNFAHNYYPILLALSVALILLGAGTKSQRRSFA
ncbi:MAG: O-antigen ligase family protein, partial [Burkholderiales bacterium]|jgi:O-antigen ligase